MKPRERIGLQPSSRHPRLKLIKEIVSERFLQSFVSWTLNKDEEDGIGRL